MSEKVLKPVPMTFEHQELVLLHKLAERAHRLTVASGDEQLLIADLAARLENALEMVGDELTCLETIVDMLPGHLQDAARRLIVYNEGDEHVAVAIWSEQDVFERARENGLKVTREQAQEVIDQMDRHQDAEIGLTWTTIDYLLDDMNLPEREEEDGEEEES